MALVLADRVRETTTVTGTGTATLLGAVSGYQSFAAVGNANTTYYVIANQSASEWEVGIGTYTSSGTTLSRDTVLSSSNSGSLVDFSAGTKDVFVDYPASKAVYENAAGNVDGYPITGGTINNTVIGGTTPAAGTFTTLTATGQTSLGGAAGSEGLRVLKTTSSVNFLQGSGAVTGSNPVLTGQGGDAEVGLDFAIRTGGLNYVRQRIASSGNIDFSLNAAGSQAMRTTIASSQVNYVQVTGAATGGAPTVISSQGSDAAVNLRLSAKGSSTLDAQVNSTTRWKINADGSVDSGISASGGISFKASATGSQVNYLQSAGAVVGSSPILSSQGTDTNISQVFQSKGTGAIDLAAGSSGVNISNGGTVTAITRTASGSGYTSKPTMVISAPTTAGGVQATVSVAFMQPQNATIGAGGTGYTVNDVLTIVGGTPTAGAATFTVTAVSGGVITAASSTNFATYSVLPTNPVSVTGGTGSGATLNIAYGLSANPGSFTITNAGSGYVEQPTVSFSGGGGSGAAAYATVGSGTVVRSLGSVVDFTMPGGVSFRVGDAGATSAQYWQAIGGAFTGILRSTGATQNGLIQTGGTGGISLQTNNGAQTQFIASHTASAVNYVQVTGNATTGSPTISTQGSDTNISMQYLAKGSGVHAFQTGSSFNQFRITATTSAVNYLAVTGGAAGAAPVMSATGSDTNIDLTLTPKGTGNVRFGTYTANMALTIQGYVEIKDSGGTVRRLAVVA
jgi:hypothetical protein